MMPGGAPPWDAAKKEDGDQRCLCVLCRFIRLVNCDRIRRAGIPLRLFTGRDGDLGGPRPAGELIVFC